MTAFLAPPRTRPGRLGLALVLLAASGQSASAQYAYGYGYARPLPGPAFEADDLVPPRAVVYRLRDRGFSEIDRPRFDGTAYVVEATDPVGDRVRLFIDGRSGGLIGRRRLAVPYYPAGRAARAAPGYGWTDEDEVGGPGRLVPPAEIPQGRPERARTALARPEPGEVRATPTRPSSPVRAGEANPLGINPDAKADGRTDARQAGEAGARTVPPRRSARLAPPRVTAPAATAPAPAPGPMPAPADAASTTPATGAPAPSTPAADTSGAKVPEPAKGGEAKGGDAKAQTTAQTTAQTWQDPPADAGRRNVRVIGGATVVPGTEAPAAGGN